MQFAVAYTFPELRQRSTAIKCKVVQMILYHLTLFWCLILVVVHACLQS